MDIIRNDLGMSLAKQLLLVLTLGRRRSSPSVDRSKQDKTFDFLSPPFIAETNGMF